MERLSEPRDQLAVVRPTRSSPWDLLAQGNADYRARRSAGQRDAAEGVASRPGRSLNRSARLEIVLVGLGQRFEVDLGAEHSTPPHAALRPVLDDARWTGRIG
jgi:hypothetical protein